MESVTGSSSLYVRSDTPEGSQDTIPSSPPIFNAPQILSSPPRTKTKKPPPVTPRSFKRFFTPRSVLGALSSGGNDRPNRHILKDICSPALNRLGPAFSRISDGSQDTPAKSSHSQDDLSTPRKKRKLSISSSSPLQSSPLRRVRIAPSIRQNDSSPCRPKVDEIGIEAEIQSEVLKTKTKQHTLPPTPLRRSHTLQTTSQIFIRSLSGNTLGTLTHRYDYGNGVWYISCAFLNLLSLITLETAWRDEVSDFYSLADDLHQCSYKDQRGERLTLPFCTVSCHSM